ncbi:soluble quino protein glucose dehydrogenase [Marasmius fiardii PR-910]|nr:soluble quino protein glucose dehydrogenase [Marasmius fiardii PR-910]
MPRIGGALLSVLFLAVAQSAAQSCPTINPVHPPVMAAGYGARVIINGLKAPRDMVFDTLGNLLIAEQGLVGIRLVKLTDYGGLDVCANSSKVLIPDASLNHGIDLSPDGSTLYVSSKTGVYSYPYNAAASTVGTPRRIIAIPDQEGHATRTIYLSRKQPELLLVSVGSNANIDPGTVDISSGRSQIRTFNLTQIGDEPVPYTFGEVLGWGLRNSVGITENSVTGGIWSVENSADNVIRDNVDVHQTNPAEELNYHGSLAGTSPEHGANFGYPLCVTAWDPSAFRTLPNLIVGTQFVVGTPNGTITDKMCQTERIAPRISFPSHTAPLDVKFKTDGSAAYITFHGSWNRQPPDGYRLSRVNFRDGVPTEAPNSTIAEIKVMTNQNNAACPDGCFRPAGLAWDSKGRLFMSSDATGEVFVITGA